MFNKSKPKTHIDSLIASNMVVEGSIRFCGGLRVDGTVLGHISELGSEPSMLIVSERGRIEGSVEVSHAVINGEIVGPVSVTRFLELQPKCRIVGDLIYQSMEVRVGAVVQGKITPANGEDERLALTLKDNT